LGLTDSNKEVNTPRDEQACILRIETNSKGDPSRSDETLA